MSILIFFVFVFSFICFLFAPLIVKILTPGFSEEKIKVVVSFTRIMFLSPIFLGISGIFGGILTSFKHFFIYSLAPVFYNLGIIIGVVFLVRIFGPSGLAWGVVLGAFLHMLIQYPAAKKLGFKFRCKFFKAFKEASVRRVFQLMIPRALGIALSQINLLVITIFASTLKSGSLAIFSFAQNLQSVPLGLFGISFAIAAFPVLSALAAKKEKKEFSDTFSSTLRQIFFFIIPLSAFIFVLRAQIVRVILGSGKFDWEDTILTFECLGIFALSLFAQSAIPLLARAFFSFQDTKTPFYVALVSEIINISLVFAFIGKFQVAGLALAFSLGSVVQFFLLLFFLRKKFSIKDDRKMIHSTLKIILASLLAAGTIQLSKNYIGVHLEIDTFLGIFVQFFASLFLGLLVFSLSCYWLKLEEFFNFKQSLSKKLFKQPELITEDTKEVSGI